MMTMKFKYWPATEQLMRLEKIVNSACWNKRPNAEALKRVQKRLQARFHSLRMEGKLFTGEIDL